MIFREFAMRPRLPPLNALKAFEAAARHESFTRAAEELCVTQGAVSHQVKALESELAIKLFNRERQRLIITEAGRDYLATVRDALDRIAAGTERLLQRQNAGVLTVSTSPDFAAKWLVHRLGHFAEAYSGIDLRVSATLHHVDFAREEVDLAVRHGGGNWPGLDAVRLCAEQLFVVCSPKLLEGRRRIGRVEDILKFPLLHLDSRSDWTNWLRGIGLDDTGAIHGPVLNRASRRGDQWTGRRARPHDLVGLGPHQRTAGASRHRDGAGVEDLLDRLPESNGKPAEDLNLPRMASDGSGDGPAAIKEADGSAR
jgi:LysR family glycine cleavage system transcriptional activator